MTAPETKGGCPKCSQGSLTKSNAIIMLPFIKSDTMTTAEIGVPVIAYFCSNKSCRFFEFYGADIETG